MLSDAGELDAAAGRDELLAPSTRPTPRAILAYTTLSLIPALAFYLVAERQLVGGLTAGVGQGMTHRRRSVPGPGRCPIDAPRRGPARPDDAWRRRSPSWARSGRSRSSAAMASTRPAGRARGGRDRPVTRLAGLHEPPPDRGGRGRPTRSSATSSRRPGWASRRSSTRSACTACIAWAAPCFQQSIGAAATFDPDTVTAMAATIRRRMLADRRAARARARPRHRARPPLGADRGDLRRGPVPRRRARLRLHRGPPGSGPRRRRRWRRPSTWSATAWPRAG